MKSLAPAVRSAIEIVGAMSEAGGAVSIADINRLTGINKNMISRILDELTYQCWVTQEDGSAGKYKLTLQPFQLFARAMQGVSVYSEALPFVKEIWQNTHESTYLAILKGRNVCYIQQLDTTKPVCVTSAVGAEYPLHMTAPGKIMLAFSHENVMEEYLDRPLEMGTSKTIITPEAVRDEIKAVRERGYALDDEEFANGIVCCAYPVFDASGYAVASIGVASSTVYGSADELSARACEVISNASGRLSRCLGYNVKLNGGNNNE